LHQVDISNYFMRKMDGQTILMSLNIHSQYTHNVYSYTST